MSPATTKEAIRPVIRRFLFWSWHASAPAEASSSGIHHCCGQRMKLYKIDSTCRCSTHQNPIARCMKCGRQFQYYYDPSGCVDSHYWTGDTDYAVLEPDAKSAPVKKVGPQTYYWLSVGVCAIVLTWVLLDKVPKEQPLWGILAAIVWPGIFLWDAIEKRKRELIIPAAIMVVLVLAAVGAVIYQRT